MTDFGFPSGGYLCSLLTDGSLLFYYRDSVRALLGFPRGYGFNMSFVSGFSRPNFTYSKHQLYEDFYLPDDVREKPGYSDNYVEDEFVNLPSPYLDSSLQSAERGQDIPRRESHFPRNDLDQLLTKSSQMPTNERVPILKPTYSDDIAQEAKQTESTERNQLQYRTNPANLVREQVQKAKADKSKIPEQYMFNETVPPNSETSYGVEVQTRSQLEDVSSNRHQVQSIEKSQHQDEIEHWIKAQLPPEFKDEASTNIQAQFGDSFPYQQLQFSKVPSVQTQLQDTARPHPPTLPYVKPKTRLAESFAWPDDESDEQVWMAKLSQHPIIKKYLEKVVACQSDFPHDKLEFQQVETQPNEKPEVSKPASQPKILWRSGEKLPRICAFWERRHLTHYQPRILR